MFITDQYHGDLNIGLRVLLWLWAASTSGTRGLHGSLAEALWWKQGLPGAFCVLWEREKVSSRATVAYLGTTVWGGNLIVKPADID